MEEKSAFDTFELNLSEEIKGYLRETSTWTLFLSILGFVGIGFMVLAGIFMSVLFASTGVQDPYESLGFSMSWMGGFYIILAVVYFFPVLYLFKFSRKMKSAITSKNNNDLTTAFQNLKSHYKFVGILTIALIALYILFAIFIGASAAAAF